MTVKISLANPFGSYFISSAVVSVFYLLEFSDIYPSLSLEMALFLFLTSGSSLLLAVVYGAVVRTASDPMVVGGAFKDKIIFILITLGFIIEFVYSKSIPLIGLALGETFDYREFGIPTFHVLLVGFCFFYAMRWCFMYTSTKDRVYLLMQYGCIAFGLLIINRGAIVISLIGFVFIYLYSKPDFRKMIKIAVLMVVIVWMFGFIGNLRFQSQEIFHEDPILRIGSASSSFEKSGLPNESFWVYLYATSPLANFQLTVDKAQVSWNYLSEGLILNFIPDFISKHLVDLNAVKVPTPELITPELTVSTAFAPAFATMGWLGPYLVYAHFVVYTLLIAVLTRRSQHHQPIMALICAQAALLLFDNMLVFSGAVGPVMIGLVLVAYSYFKTVLKRSGRHESVTETLR